MKIQRNRLTPVLALVAVLALLAAGCGKSSKSSSTTTAAADQSTTTAGSASSTTAAGAATGLDKVSGTLHGQGSSFQDTFEQKTASDFAAAVKSAGGNVTVLYTKTGSSDGKKVLADQSVDFAGSDSAIKPAEQTAFGTRKILYFPVVGGPISLAYKLQGVPKLRLSADTISKIFQAQITSWDDAAIKADNPGVTLPATKIAVVHRSDGSGTTSNFTKYLTAAAPTSWKLGNGEKVNWPASTQGAEKSSGVISVVKQTEGAIAYADLADAAKENLDVASVKNSSGTYIAPTPDAASAALAAATVKADLTYNPINAKAADAYPITSPTWILVDAKQKSAAKAAAIKAYLNFVLTTGQAQAKSLYYSALPKALADKAITQIDQITAG
ncbi:MAG: Phosphate-binding protein PstS [Acidimicrobiales bacterium]|nr:Phosphate-binding protein PstS [Acidimicrobiales bacterium]